MVKGEVDWSKPPGVDAAHMAAVGMGGIEAWVGRLNPLSRTRGGPAQPLTKSRYQSKVGVCEVRAGARTRPPSHVHSISDDDLVGKVEIVSI